jgi:beta-glucosidase
VVAVSLKNDQLPGSNTSAASKYNPAYPFGHGLSYTAFTTSTPTATPEVSDRDTVKVRVTVANTGSRDGATTVPVYVHQPVSRVLVPDKRLVAFTRVALKAGEQQQVEIAFDVEQLALTVGDVDGAGRREVEKGLYEVVVGAAKTSFTVR